MLYCSESVKSFSPSSDHLGAFHTEPEQHVMLCGQRWLISDLSNLAFHASLPKQYVLHLLCDMTSWALYLNDSDWQTFVRILKPRPA